MRTYNIKNIFTCKAGLLLKYCIILIILISFSGCFTPHVRYTRPSRSRGEKEKVTSPEKEIEKEQEKTISEMVSESKLKKIVDSYIGVPYKYTGTTRKGMDCSGFVYRVYTDLGNNDFPRTSSARLSGLGTSVPRREMQPGDLVFFRKVRRINHVGIYMGDNKFVHASLKKGIIYTSLDNEYFRNRLVRIRRID